MRTLPLLLAVCILAGCSDETSSTSTGAVRLALSGTAAHDVTMIELTVVPDGDDCATGTIVRQALLAADPLPPSVGGGDGHPFAHALFALEPGTYAVCAAPLKADFTPSDVCGGATASGVNVASGVTTEVDLWSHCLGDESGVLDAAVGLDGAPVIEDVTITPSKWIILCQQAAIQLTARDPDDDTLSYSWMVSAPATLSVHDDYATFSTTAPGDYTIGVTVSSTDAQTVITFPIHVQDKPCTWMLSDLDAGANRDIAVTSNGEVVYADTLSGEAGKVGAGGEPMWTRSLPNLGGTIGRRLVVEADDAGNVIIAGGLNESSDFGCGPLTYTDATRVFVAKLSAVDGACMWSHVLVGNFIHDLGIRRGTDPASSGDDEVVTLAWDGVDSRLVRHDALGNFLSSVGLRSADRLAVTPSGDIAVTGEKHTPGSVTFSTPTGSYTVHHPNSWVALFGDDGVTAEWVKTIPKAEATPGLPMDVAATPDGDLVVAAVVTGDVPLDFGDGPIGPSATGDRDTVVARLSGQDGALSWTAQSHATSVCRSVDIAVASDGTVMVLGGFDDTVNFGSGELVAPSPTGQFLAFLTAAGHPKAAWSWNGVAVTGAHTSGTVASDADGHVYLHLGGATSLAETLGDAGPSLFSPGNPTGRYIAKVFAP